MNERDAFIRAIAADLYDDTARLAFADWLDEHGEHDRAAFIRVQCELEPIRDRYEIPRAAELHERENALLRGAGRGDFNDSDLPGEHWQRGCEFRRGFVDTICLNAKLFVEHGDTIRSRFPTLRRLVVHCFIGWGERVAACAALRGLPELELACWYDDADIAGLGASPHLADLRTLVLWTGRQTEFFEDTDLCRLAAEGTAWPNLRELVLVDPEGESEPQVRQLVDLVNRTAKRDIGQYERGYPELFPLAAHFYHEFPACGHLPDGRTAVVFLDNGPDPRSRRGEIPVGFVVATFDATGGQTDELIRVPLSPELIKNWWDHHHKDDDVRTRHLTDTIGFVPGFIRVKGYYMPVSDATGPHRGRYDSWNSRGYPDVPGGDSGGEHPNGRGGNIYGLVRNGEFEISSSGWADKSGSVHST